MKGQEEVASNCARKDLDRILGKNFFIGIGIGYPEWNYYPGSV